MPINGHPLYEISNLGRVKSLPNAKHKTTRILRPPKDRDGYRTIILCDNGKQRRCKIHHLVAEHFIRPRLEGEEIDHINGNREDNRSENLRWCNRLTNMTTDLFRRNASLAKPKRPVICIETDVVYESAHDAARKTGINRCAIMEACNKPSYTAGKYHWKFYSKEL